MLLKLSETWTRWAAYTKSRWQKFGYLLSLASFAYLVLLLVYGGLQLWNINWVRYSFPILGALIIHLISSVLQFFIWARLLSDHHQIGWQDLAIYSRVLMLRRLPGGVWHWIGRTAMYSESTKVSAKVSGLANFVEWAMLILTAAGISVATMGSLPLFVRLPVATLVIGVAIWIGFSWQLRTSAWLKRLMESTIWVFLYGIAWWLGGLVVYWCAQTTQILLGSINPLDLTNATRIWASAAGGSMILVFVPSGLGIREISITWLLQNYLPSAGALAIALLIRFVFTLGDFLWGSLGWYSSNWVLRRKTKLMEN